MAATNQTEFPIEQGVPIPRLAPHRLYPFGDMDVGDSFFIALKEGEFKAMTIRKVRSAASYYGRRNGKKYVTRRVSGGLRVWRIA